MIAEYFPRTKSSRAMSSSTPPIILSFSVPWQQDNLLTFLRRAGHASRFFWENENQPLGFAGFGVAASIQAQGKNRFHTIQTQAADIFARTTQLAGDVPDFLRPRFFGGFSFSPTLNEQEPWQAFSPAHFILPQYLLTHYEGTAWLTIHLTIPADTPDDEYEWRVREALWDIPPVQTLPPRTVATSNGAFATDSTLSFDMWATMIAHAQQDINAGRIQKVVLSTHRCGTIPDALTPPIILGRLRGRYPDCNRFLFEPRRGHAFFGASPERLVKRVGNRVETVALAGSAPRGSSFEEDRAFGDALLNSEKDRAEHAFVVDAVQQNLGPITDTISVKDKPELYRLNNIQHLLTPIRAELSRPAHVLDIVERLHPTPAVGGVPQADALDFIQNHEPHNRGWYASPIGWFDANGDGEFIVALRSAALTNSNIHLFAGAGIVGASDAEKEWREIGLKFRPIQDTLSGVGQ